MSLHIILFFSKIVFKSCTCSRASNPHLLPTQTYNAKKIATVTCWKKLSSFQFVFNSNVTLEIGLRTCNTVFTRPAGIMFQLAEKSTFNLHIIHYRS